MANIFTLSIVFLALAVTACSGDKQMIGVIHEFGIFQIPDKVIDKRNPATFSGNVREARSYSKLIKQTNRIPLIKDTLFQFCFIISELPKDRGMLGIHIKIDHPEMIKPDSTKSTGFEFIEKHTIINGTIDTCTGYVLNKPYELVPGLWRFTYSNNDKVILQQEFTTYAL